jgi:DNA processing protein
LAFDLRYRPMNALAPAAAQHAETRAMLALHFTRGLGPVRIKALLAHYESAQAILAAPSAQLREQARELAPGIENSALAAIGSEESLKKADEELAKVEKHQFDLITLGSAGYPEALAAIYDPPPVLWLRLPASYDWDAILDNQLAGPTPQAIGIVGTRQCSPYARDFAAELARDLAELGVVVVSGLARGIDTAAHKAAVDVGGLSIAVLGCGVDRVYPAENAALATQLAMVSAYPVGTTPAAHNFPARNRIIAGLCSGSVVVEGDVDSGAMITAVAALDAGRSVFAVPGRAKDPKAQGPHKLLREGAAMCEGIDDILQELRWGTVRTTAQVAPTLAGAEQTVYNALTSALLADDLVQSTQMATPEVLSTLMMLSLKGLVRELPGGRFERS